MQPVKEERSVLRPVDEQETVDGDAVTPYPVAQETVAELPTATVVEEKEKPVGVVMVQGGTSQAGPVYPPVHTHVPSFFNSGGDPEPAEEQQVGGDVAGKAGEYPVLHVHELAGTAASGMIVESTELVCAGHAVPQSAP